MDKAVRVFLACAIGAGIGTLSALQLGYLWGLGALLGGLVGYLIYDLEQVIKMIPVAWNYAVNWRWEPNWIWWKALAVVFFGYLSRGISIGVVVALFFTYLCASDDKVFPHFSLFRLAVIFLAVSEVIVPAAAFITSSLGVLMIALDGDPTSQKERFRAWNSIKWHNPFVVYIYYPIKGVIWAVPRIPAGIMILLGFIKHLFFLIHSDLRLLCGVDSLIGASVGYFTGNVLMGALVGGALGVLNYELVSKRWLKVELRN